MMAWVYLNTCTGGNHHLFEDDVTLERVVHTTEELREEHLTRGRRDLLINQLPGPIKAAIIAPGNGNGFK